MKKTLVLAAMLAAVPFAATAGDINYNYIEGGYSRADLAGEDGDGYFAKGSVAFGESFYGNLSYQDVTNDDAGFDVSLDETVLGLGYRHALSDSADLNAELSYVNLGVGVEGFGSDDSDGYRVAVGARGMLAPNFEGNIKGYYTEISDLDGGEFGAQIGGVYHFNQTWGVVGSFDHTKLLDEGINIWHIGVRASF